MKKYAVIDIGTNSTRLLLATVEDDIVVNRQKHLISTRMGQGVDCNRVINQETLERNILALKKFKEISQDVGVEDTIIFGTSALRDATNGTVFVHMAKEQLQMTVQIISGKLEALYAFLGVGNEYQNENIIIMDIGGGSTEFVTAYMGKLTNSISLDMGAVRLTEKFVKNDPPSKEEISQVKAYIQNLLQERISIEREPFSLIGIGGTATTLSSIKNCMPEYSPEKIHGSEVHSIDVDKIIDDLISVEDFERKKIVGLNPKRSDIIIAGAMIAQSILSYYNKDRFMVSDNDNLEGALHYYIKNKKRY